MNLQGLTGKEVFHPAGATGLGMGVVALQATPRGEPEGIFVVDGLGRVPVGGAREDTAPVHETIFVQAWCPGVVLVGHRPVIFTIVDTVPIEAVVEWRDLAQLVEHVLC